MLNKEIRLFKKEETEDYDILTYCGGNNGHADWPAYFKAISELASSLIAEYNVQTDALIVKDVTVDMLDDIFYVEFIIYK